MLDIKHDIETWFGSTANFITYFETEFKENKIGKLRVPASTVRRFNNLATTADREKAILGIAETYLQGIVKLKAKQLHRLKWIWLVAGGTQRILKDAVCEAVQHAILNVNVWERVNASSISTNSFSINTDNPGWLLTADMYGKQAWTLIQNSKIDKYHIRVRDMLTVLTDNGNIRIIGRINAADAKFIKEI